MKKSLLLLAVAWLVPAVARADVRPNALCTDGMVLQQKSQAKVWGTADKGERVSVTFRDKSANAVADDQGLWSLSVDTGAAGGPFKLVIEGKNRLAYENVLVGEVWVCSGQSNMEWRIDMCNEADKTSAKSDPHNAKLRMFTVKKNVQLKPQTEATGSWIEADPETVGGFSAVGFFFGRDLQRKLGVPVGLINTNWGGTRVQAWTSKDMLDGNPFGADEHAKLAVAMAVYKKAAEAPPAKDGKDAKKLVNPAQQPNSPSVLYNGMIAPILPYAIKGAIWYQGESNAREAFKYRTLFPLMIENWRRDFKQGDFPFYFVQLAPFTPVASMPGESDWAELREAQTMTLRLPRTGMAVITDFGNEYDIHPTPKQPVGERLALIARAKDYGESVAYSGPTHKGMKIAGEKVIITFDNAGSGLTTKKLVPTLVREKQGAAWRVDPDARDAELVGFTVCGKDRVFKTAKAVIQGSEVVVSSSEVTEPIAVRYGWANHPICNLYNRDGLPASPFRTDEFPGITQPKQ